MNKKTILFCLITCYLSFAFRSNAQYDLSTAFIPEIWASSFSNPAWIPEGKLHVGLPTYFFNTNGTTVDPRNYINFSGRSPQFDLAKFTNELDDEFQTEIQNVFHPLYFSFNLNDFRIGLEYSFRNNTSVRLPADLFKLTAFGNAPYVGQTLTLGPEVFSSTYQQLAIPLSIEKGKWTIGVRPSIIKGIFSVQTLQSELELFTDPEYYQLSLNGDFYIQSSGVLTTETDNPIGASWSNNIFGDGLSWKGNTGYNVDIGFRYRHNEKLSLGASITGLGQITWDQNNTAFSSNGSNSFSGIDLSGLVNGDSLDVEKTVDDLVTTFQLSPVEQSNFKTETTRNIYLNARYELNEIVEFGGMFYGALHNGNFEPAFALNARIQAMEKVHVGFTYGVLYNKWTNLGINILVELGPFQLFAATNNFINVIDLGGNKPSNARVGLSLVFNKNKSES